jgi:Skp family chaperone for outer membrane proteins
MNKLLALLLASLFATASFAAAHMGTAPATSAANPKPMEAMKSGDPKAEAAAQAKVDAKVKAGDKSAMQPEAMAQGSDKAKAKAEMKKKAKVGKKNSTDEQMKKDGAKL